ncbi:MAG: RepB family plasmid replication initiator protein [Syntrophobacterales bacterium]|nr:MAG: RepB family plasmid replication initiator protein [Syntrophobacterales bacterium]
MAKKVSPRQKDVVIQANDLVHARYSLPAAEKKLVALVYSKILKEDVVFKDYEFQIKEVCEYMGMDYRNAEVRLKELSESILSRPVMIYDTDKGEWDGFNWVSWVSFRRKAGTVTFTLPPKIGPYLLKLEEQYTNVPVSFYMQLTGKYSLRLIECLMQWRSTADKHGRFKVPTIPADKLRGEWELGKSYTNKELKRSVIDRAVAEINEADLGLLVKVESSLRGRTLYGFDFSCRIYTQEEARPVEPLSAQEEADDVFIAAHQKRFDELLALERAEGSLLPNAGFNTPHLLEMAQRGTAIAKLRVELAAKKKKGTAALKKPRAR